MSENKHTTPNMTSHVVMMVRMRMEACGVKICRDGCKRWIDRSNVTELITQIHTYKVYNTKRYNTDNIDTNLMIQNELSTNSAHDAKRL